MKTSAQFIFASALGASMFIHGSVYTGFKVAQVMQLNSGIPVQAVPKLPDKVTFEFIDIPDEQEAAAPETQTNHISAKNSKAKDLVQDLEQANFKGPALQVVPDAQQLDKKTQPNAKLEDKKGTPIPQTEYITPIEPKALIQEPAEMEEAYDTDKKEESVLEKQKEKVARKREKEMSQTLKPQGNAEQNRRIVVYDPSRNLDTYQAQAVQKFLASAVDIGSSSFDAKQHFLGPYLKKLKSRVSPLWLLKLETESAGRLLETKKVVIGVQIMADGSLGALLILQDFGDDLFNKLCLDTFIELVPFEPPPKEWLEKTKLGYLNIIYRFQAF